MEQPVLKVDCVNATWAGHPGEAAGDRFHNILSDDQGYWAWHIVVGFERLAIICDDVWQSHCRVLLAEHF